MPLLKHELWSSIQSEYKLKTRFEVKINSCSLERRADRKRYIFHAESKS